MGQVTFSTQNQQYGFVDKPSTEIDLSYVIYHENHDQCYYITYFSELKSAPFLTFPFSTIFVICKERSLHIPKSKIEISEDESLNSEIGILAIRPHMKSVNEGRGLSKQSEENKKEFKTLDNRGQDVEEENDDVGFSLLLVITVGEFNERLEQLQRLYVSRGLMIPDR